MNYAIEHSKENHKTLFVTPRKRVLKNTLLTVHSGLVLFKLKKFEYALQNGDSFWIPAECLTSLCYLPNTEVTKIDFSVRLNNHFPNQAGYVSLPTVSKAIIEKLSLARQENAQTNNLLQVLRDEIGELSPALELTSLSDKISRWNLEINSELSVELQLVLKVREARKRLLSGVNRQTIIEELFSGSEKEFTQITELLLGAPL